MDDTNEPDSSPEIDTSALDDLAKAEKGQTYIPKGEQPPPGGNEETETKKANLGDINTGEACASILLVTFQLLAQRLGPHWALSLEEAQMAGEAYGNLIDKYYPDVQIGFEATAMIVTGAIFVPRLAQHKAYQAAKQQAEQTDETEQTEQTEQTDNGEDA